MKDVLHYAAAQGISVHATHMPTGVLGYFEPARMRIWFDIGLTPSEIRSVIAHELGHYYYGHQCDSAANERQANFYAASLLIDPREFARLERIDPDLETIADEFCVTPEVISDYKEHCLRKIGPAIYSRRTNDRERRLV